MLETNLVVLQITREAGVETALAVYRQQGAEYAIRAKVVIDASDDAVAGKLAGAITDAPDGNELQNATLIFRVSGVNRSDLAGYFRLKLSATIARGASVGADSS